MDSYVSDRAPLLPVCVSLIVGILMGFALKASITLLPFLAGMVVLALCLYRHPMAQSLAILLSVMLLGMILAGRQWQESRRYSYDEKFHELQAVVVSEGVEKPRSMAFDVLLASNGRKVKCYVEKNERSRRLKPGDGLLLRTKIQPFENSPQLPSAFDYKLYMERHGYTGHCYVKDDWWAERRVSLKEISRWQRGRIVFLRLRHHLLERYRQLGAESDSYAVLAAMTLGDKSALNKELREVYSVTGASHVLALSGLHLGILYMLLSLLTGNRRRRSIWSQAVLVLGVWSFAMLVGMPVSVVRSALMISLFAIFSLGYRPHLSVNLLCLAAIIILGSDPFAVYDVGFQLSFAAVAGILLLLPLFEMPSADEWRAADGRQSRWQRLLRPVTSCLKVSLVAQIGVAPLIAFHFGRFSTYFLLTNLIVMPVVYLILCGAFLMLLFPLVAPVVVWLVHVLNHALTFMASMPLSSINDLHLSVAQVVMWYVAVAALSGALLIWKGRWNWD